MNHEEKELCGESEEENLDEVKQRRRNADNKATCTLKRNDWRKGVGPTDGRSLSYLRYQIATDEREWPRE